MFFNSTFENLNTLLNILLINSNAHICVHDISGILELPGLNIDSKYKIHSKPFCSATKQTSNGYRLCLFCKMCANQKAIEQNQMFSGYCPYGLYEVACPVEVCGNVLAIVYVGNLVISESESKKRIRTACRATGASADALYLHLLHRQSIRQADNYREMAGFIAAYIEKLYTENNKMPSRTNLHWAVNAAAEYIKNNYTKNIILKDVARLHFINEKYLGYIFAKQMKISFNSYLNNIRLEHAKAMLLNTSESIIAVSLACGYQNVTYFNRVFKKITGKTPSDFRNENKKTAFDKKVQ